MIINKNKILIDTDDIIICVPGITEDITSKTVMTVNSYPLFCESFKKTKTDIEVIIAITAEVSAIKWHFDKNEIDYKDLRIIEYNNI